MRAFALAAAVVASGSVLAQSVTDPSLVVEPWLGGIDQPTGIRFTGPGEGFLIEKTGAVKRFANGSASTILTVPVNSFRERGLLGLELHPNFSANPYVYLYHTAPDPITGDWLENRLMRYTWNGSTLVSPTQLNSHFGSSSEPFALSDIHYGGPLTFGRDGKLYGVVGELNRWPHGIETNQPMSVRSIHVGGVYRLNADGTVPSDNPFANDTNADVRRWYTYGLRNSFGIAVDPVTGNVWNTENGPEVYDEINLLTAGMNSGWSKIMGPDSRDPQNAPGSLKNLAGSQYSDPEFSFRRPIGITSIEFLADSNLPGYEDAVLVGEYAQGRLWLLRLNQNRDGFVLEGGLADGVLDDTDVLAAFGTGFGIVTDIQVGPDGALYILGLSADQVWRIGAIPEPHSWILSLVGLALIGCAVRKRCVA